MAKNLVIVESPAKAKTIEKYLGKDFKVLSSIGHIRSIAKKTKGGKPGVDISNGFKTAYEIDADKTKIITQLKKAVKSSAEVWLATDEDREGEAIAWHLCEVLKLDPKKTKRIVFHEITKEAIEQAVKSPRTVDMSLVRAQQARQILDRIVGFDLSDVVRKKVPGGVSAGRVQSPGVRLLVEREREIDAFKSSSEFKITAVFKSKDGELKAELDQRFASQKPAANFLEGLTGKKFAISGISTSPHTRNPSPPFTTSTLQQDANSRLGFGARATMAAAQKLYQSGKITYMRTDSVNLGSQALGQTAEYIKKQYGEQYHQIRTFKTKSSGAQEAHEAIRPTNMAREQASSDRRDQKLYDLIRNRTLASQMAPARLERTTITIEINGSEHKFEAKGEVILFDGFLKVYGVNKKEEDILPIVEKGNDLHLIRASARQLFSRPPARFSEGSLVKKLEELGIGRPSTYATIIGTIQARGYAEKGESEGYDRESILLEFQNGNLSRQVETEKFGSTRGKLVPTASGMVMSDFLEQNFDPIVDYGFTAGVETQFDDIAAGKLKRNEMLSAFYTPFHKLVAKSADIDRSKVAKAKELGTDPVSGKPVIARFGRYGPMLQLGSTDDEEHKPRFAPLPKGARLETVRLDEALEMFKLPRTLGSEEDGTEILANIGRFGPYIQKGKLYASIPKDEDVFAITLKRAKELIKQKEDQKRKSLINSFDGGIQIKVGRFGPYVTDGKVNAKVPKGQDPKKLSEKQAKDLLKKKAQA
ncbi:MAG TPA: type I DNA topoisomerase [Candidatus Saccharimonadales bacterium]